MYICGIVWSLLSRWYSSVGDGDTPKTQAKAVELFVDGYRKTSFSYYARRMTSGKRTVQPRRVTPRARISP